MSSVSSPLGAAARRRTTWMKLTLLIDWLMPHVLQNDARSLVEGKALIAMAIVWPVPVTPAL
ncbi:MAG: hypothetical protein WDO13_06140 [Verrucomicrobiota bacterium]